MITVRVPASTANLGPAFDCLGLTLDLWNETQVELSGDQLVIEVEGPSDQVPRDRSNLIAAAFHRLYREAGEPLPKGLHIHAKQNIPVGSGLSSSAVATVAGLLAANAALGNRLNQSAILQLGAEIEGHADNFAASLLGGLVLVTQNAGLWYAQRIECAPVKAVVIVPEFAFTTSESRGALPQDVSLRDAVFNIGKSLAVVEAFRSGDIPSLAEAMQDRLHQQHRLPLIPGASEALAAAQQAGAAAALSGAGPSIIAFVEDGRQKAVAEALRAPFHAHKIKTGLYSLQSTTQGASVTGA
jgi:homoserine kinase